MKKGEKLGSGFVTELEDVNGAGFLTADENKVTDTELEVVEGYIMPDDES